MTLFIQLTLANNLQVNSNKVNTPEGDRTDQFTDIPGLGSLLDTTSLQIQNKNRASGLNRGVKTVC